MKKKPRQQGLTETDLQFWHAELNNLFFEGLLSTALVKKIPVKGMQDTGFYIAGNTSPIMLQYYMDMEKQEPFTALEMLHNAMVDQFCVEHNMIGRFPDGSVTSNYKDIARRTGKDKNGLYTAESKKRIIKLLDEYMIIRDLQF